jgi:hypothetical protein
MVPNAFLNLVVFNTAITLVLGKNRTSTFTTILPQMLKMG